MSQEVLQKVFALTAVIVKEEGCELLDVDLVFEHGKRVLKLFIDKEGGVQLGDCAKVSHAVEDLLEVEELISGKYNLEVSSPGLNRPLRLKEHFDQVIGKTINVTTKEKIDGRKHYKGVLQQVDNGKLVIKIDQQNYSVPLTMMARANLVFEEL